MLLSHRTTATSSRITVAAAQPLVPRSVLAGSGSGSGSSSGGGAVHLLRRSQPHSAARPHQQQQPLVPAAPTARPIGNGFGSSMSLLAPPVSSRQATIVRSFLGVGAPEAILVAVVALVVFGPKGLADAAKSLGQTLRAFQPTIKEVVQVSQEIKGTLEQELGLDELRNAATMRPTPRPMPAATPTSSSTSTTSSGDEAGGAAAAAAGGEAGSEAASSSSSTNPSLRAISEDLAKQLDPDIELKRAMSEQAAWGGQPPAAAAAAAEPVAAVAAAAAGAAAAAAPGKDLSTLSVEELEAELQRRKSSAA